MGYQLPHYIINAKINRPEINYSWDDYAEQIIPQLQKVSLRAKIALIIGIHEWVIGRFQGLTNDLMPYQVAEAAWCANVDAHYIQFTEYDYKDYDGPIERALFFSAMSVLPVLYVSENIINLDNQDEIDPDNPYDPDEWQNSVRDIISLAVHIMPEPALFKQWLETIVERLNHLYQQAPQNPFANLFGNEDDKDWLGDYVAREVLDPEYDYSPEQAVPLLNRLLSQVDHNNPLLASQKTLAKYIKTPFVIS